MCFSPQGDLLATSGPVRAVSGFMMCAGGPSCNRSMQARLASGRLPSLVIPPVLSVSVTIGVSGRGKPEPVVPAGITRPHLNSTGVFVISPAGDQIFIAGADGRIRSFDTASGEMSEVRYRHPSPVCCLNVSPDGRLLAVAGQDHTVCLSDWKYRDGLPDHSSILRYGSQHGNHAG